MEEIAREDSEDPLNCCRLLYTSYIPEPESCIVFIQNITTDSYSFDSSSTYIYTQADPSIFDPLPPPATFTLIFTWILSLLTSKLKQFL